MSVKCKWVIHVLNVRFQETSRQKHIFRSETAELPMSKIKVIKVENTALLPWYEFLPRHYVQQFSRDVYNLLHVLSLERRRINPFLRSR